MIRTLARALLATAFLLGPLAARADEIEVVRAVLEPAEEGYALAADFDFELSTRLEDALSKGVPLYFLYEFECTRSRWYWLDEKVASATQTVRLSFHALTRTYRLSGGGLTQSFPTLAEALRSLARVRGWVVIERDRIKPDTSYNAALRMRLDTTQLPKPFQVSALANRDWTLSSPWKRWQFALNPTGEAAK